MKLLLLISLKQIVLLTLLLILSWAGWGPVGPEIRASPLSLFRFYLPLALAMSAGFITLIALLLQIIFSSAPTSIAYLSGLLSGRSEERRVGNELARTCRSRWPPYK